MQASWDEFKRVATHSNSWRLTSSSASGQLQSRVPTTVSESSEVVCATVMTAEGILCYNIRSQVSVTIPQGQLTGDQSKKIKFWKGGSTAGQRADQCQLLGKWRNISEGPQSQVSGQERVKQSFLLLADLQWKSTRGAEAKASWGFVHYKTFERNGR